MTYPNNMTYLSPKADIVFKKLFGNIAHKNIIISFLNSVLKRVDRETIIDIMIIDPSNIPDTLELKTSIVDIRCTDQNGHQYIVEMQIVAQKDYAIRAQYYAAIALARQLNASEKYSSLVPVVFVGILDFNLFDSSEYLSHHLILDGVTYAHKLKHLEFHFIELSKFTKTEAQLDNILDKWVYFLKNAEILQKVPDSFQEPELTTAFHILSQSNWSKQELFNYDKYLDAWRSTASQLETAVENKAVEIAINLLNSGVDIKTVSQATGLDIMQIQKLKKF